MSKRLTSYEKRRNATTYRQIRKGYNELMRAKPDTQLTYIQFKNRVLAKKKAYGYTTLQGIKKASNTEDIVSPAERSRNNLLQALREDFKDEYKKITSLTRGEKGRFISKENLRNKLIWTKFGNKRGYKFQSTNGKWYFIDVSNSPKGVNIIEFQDKATS